MNERTMQFRVGAVVLATLIIGGLLVTMNTSTSGWLPWGGYKIAIELDEAPGIGPNTPVRRNGVLVGRVEEIVDGENKVRVIAKIDDDRKIQTSDLCQVTVSVLGDSTIEFSGTKTPSGQYWKDGDIVPGVVGKSPFDAFLGLEGDLRTTVESLGEAGDEVAKLANRINTALGEGDEQRLARAIDSFDRAMQSIDEIIGDPQVRADLRQGIKDIPETLAETRQTFRDARATLDEMQGAVTSAERNLKNLEGFTEPLGRRGEDVTDTIVSAVDGIDRLLEELTVFTRAVTSSEGTIGQLIRDRRFYDNANQLIVNTNVVVVKLNDLLCYLNERVPPIVEDARVFMDKVAREPGRIVGGALNRGPGIK